MVRLALVAVATLALAACNGEPQQAGSDAARQAQDSTAAPAEPEAAAPAKAARNAAGREITLAADGVVLIGAVEGRGTATTLSFGRGQQSVLDVMAVDFAPPKISANDECGAGPMEFAQFGALTLNFLEGKFVGWHAEKARNLVTVDGIRPGDSFAKVESENAVRLIEDSTLGQEFETSNGEGDPIGGFVEGEGEAAKVASLHAGINCFFR